MPIYRYTCNCCKKTDDYLVGKPGAYPEKCSGCDNVSKNNFERIYSGVPFAAITHKERITRDGERFITHDSSGKNLDSMVGLEPGINIIQGRDSKGRDVLEITNVCPEHGPIIDLKITAIRPSKK